MPGKPGKQKNPESQWIWIIIIILIILLFVPGIIIFEDSKEEKV
ncbi:hypothetical protein [Caldanaerobacter subterraneus]|nr:hypothetical protein [Caldanaerobacter subterraneus]